MYFRVLIIYIESFIEVLCRLLIIFHVIVASSSIAVEINVCRLFFNCLTVECDCILVVTQLVMCLSDSVVDPWILRVTVVIVR